MGIKTLYIAEANIRIRLGFKSGSWGDQGNNTVILWLFVLLFNSRFESQSNIVLKGSL